MKIKYLFLFMLTFVVACNQATDNEDGGQDNFNFSEDEVGKLKFTQGDFDFGDVLIDDERKRFIEVENTGLLSLKFEQTLFEGRNFHPSIFYSGSEKTFPGEGGTCREVLPAGETCLLAFSFLPVTTKQEDIPLVVIFNNSLIEQSVEINIKGYGGEEADLFFSRDALDFGFVDVDTDSEQTITVTNSGSQNARDIIVKLSQTVDSMGRNLFSIVESKTTCPLVAGLLNRGSSCDVTIRSLVNHDQAYEDYQGTLIIEYKDDPGTDNIKDINIDILQKVVSLEGELKVPKASIGFGDFINFDIGVQSLFIKNQGYAELSLETVSIAGDFGSLSVNITECTERNDERFSTSGKLLLGIGESCILGLVFSPRFASLPTDLSKTDIVFTYNDGKNGIQTTNGFGMNAELFEPAKLDIQAVVDPALEVWDLGNVFVANDTRFKQTRDFIIKNTGDVVAKNISISLSGSPYISYTHNCPDVLGEDEECTVSMEFNPLLATYLNNASTLDLMSSLEIKYEAGDSDVLNDTKVTTTEIQTTGTMTAGSQLVFSTFDTVTSSSSEAVRGSSLFYDIRIKNVGAVQEDNFSLNFSNAADFFIIDDVGLPFIDGLKNCALHDSGDGSLFSGEECVYRIRGFSAVIISTSNIMDISFQSGTQTSGTHTLVADFVAPAQLAMSEPLPATKAVIKSYQGFNYPGAGQTTDINDANVDMFFSSTDQRVDISNMSFPALPATEVFDFAYVEAGFAAINAPSRTTFQFNNLGSFDMEIREVSIVDAYNLDSGTDVTSSNIFSLDLTTTETCAGSLQVTKLRSGGGCLNRIDYTIPGNDLYRFKLNVRYTLGDTVSPTDTTLQVYDTVVSVYVKGYNASLAAMVQPLSPVSVVSDSRIIFETVNGGDNSNQAVVSLTNVGAVAATNVHYTVLEAGEFRDVNSGSSDLTIVGLTPAGVGLDNYYRLASGQCSVGTTDEYQLNENCAIDLTFAPTQDGTKKYIIVYRYFNGVTYDESSFEVLVTGLKPAAIVVNNLTGTHPTYENNFGKELVNDVHTQSIELRNTGEVDATNLNFVSAVAPFSLVASTNPGDTPCGTVLGAGDTCHLELHYQPTYTEIEQSSQHIFNVAWDTGIMNLGVPEAQGLTVSAEGFAEERYSLHQGWTNIDLRGFNKDYADAIQGVLAKPNGDSYEAQDLGFIHLKWNPMIDSGPQTNSITGYAILKSESSTFDIHTHVVYATVNVVGGETEFEYIDNSIDNVPGKVFYYYIIPRRGASGYASRVKISDYPSSVLRVAIPHPYTVGIHRFQSSMNACRAMGKDVSDVTNINLANNGCIYENSLGANVTYDPNYDVHVDMYEGTQEYISSASFEFTNYPGFPVVPASYDAAVAACSNKTVTFSTTDPVLSRSYFKELPSRSEHFTLSTKIGGYAQGDCEIVDNEIITGAQASCVSDLGLENMVGGLPEWTLDQVSGNGKGISTSLANGGSDISVQGIDFTFLFNNLATGFNTFRLDDNQNKIDNHCFSIFGGLFVPKVGGVCGGDNLLEMTSVPALESPTRLYLLDTEPIDTTFKLLLVGAEISEESSLSIHALAGGGDAIDSELDPNHNYSQYNTEFTFSANDKAGFRCSLRLPY